MRAKSLPTGNRNHPNGFTLIELLVVLAIMALLLTAMPALISASQATARIRNMAQELADDLRMARLKALTGNGETQLVLDLAHHRYAAMPGGQVRVLPPDAGLTFLGPVSEVHGDSADIRFFPDGTSSGGRIGLSLGSSRRQITAHWLTGRIAVDE